MFVSHTAIQLCGWAVCGTGAGKHNLCSQVESHSSISLLAFGSSGDARVARLVAVDHGSAMYSAPCRIGRTRAALEPRDLEQRISLPFLSQPQVLSRMQVVMHGCPVRRLVHRGVGTQSQRTHLCQLSWGMSSRLLYLFAVCSSYFFQEWNVIYVQQWVLQWRLVCSE